jgi:hypothetical protein
MREVDGSIHAKCEFCTTTYKFSAEELIAGAQKQADSTSASSTSAEP